MDKLQQPLLGVGLFILGLSLGWGLPMFIESTPLNGFIIIVIGILASTLCFIYAYRLYKRQQRKLISLEKPWSRATLIQYPIAAEVIPLVIKVWEYRTEKESELTIREARWVAYLSGQVKDIDKLSDKAWQYARTELMFEILNLPFDSTELDKSLMGIPVEISGFKSFLWLLAQTREDKDSGIKDGVEQVRDLISEKKLKRKIGESKIKFKEYISKMPIIRHYI